MTDQQVQGSERQSWLIAVDRFPSKPNGDRLTSEAEPFKLWYDEHPEVWDVVEVVPRSVAEALAEALESLTTFLGYSAETQTHQTIGEACGVDLCIVCLAESTAAEALRDYRSRHPRETPCS